MRPSPGGQRYCSYCPSVLVLGAPVDTGHHGAPALAVLGTVTCNMSPHRGDGNPGEWRSGPRLSRDEAGTSAAIPQAPRKYPWGSGACPGKLCPHLPWGSLTHMSLLPGQRPSPPQSGVRGCRDAAPCARPTPAQLGVGRLPGKKQTPGVPQQRIDAHLKEMIPTSHLTIIFQLIVI